MAVVQNPLIGRAKNSVGGTIFSTWKGKNVIRSKPITVRNPNTDKQKAQRTALALGVKIYRSTASAVKLGFVQQAVGKSEYNAFMEVILRDGIIRTPPDATVDYPELKFSRGTMAPTMFNEPYQTSNDDEIGISWIHVTLGVGQSLTDVVHGVAYSESLDQWAVINGPETREADSAVITFGGYPASASIIHIYMFFTSADGKTASDSVYTTKEFEL